MASRRAQPRLYRLDRDTEISNHTPQRVLMILLFRVFGQHLVHSISFLSCVCILIWRGARISQRFEGYLSSV